ncbi:hypothetical protein Q426_02420 [Streptococcus equi subsp. zooepidemicus CY]|nr:hypothetical protein Q426_02420 [Streptococcus equi subsp. zooepidemicus CY]
MENRVAKKAETGIIIPLASKNQVVACWVVDKGTLKFAINVGIAVPKLVWFKTPAKVPTNSNIIISVR